MVPYQERKPRMNEEQVGNQIPDERCVRLDLRVAQGICDRDREDVRGHDLDETAPGKIAPLRRRGTGDGGADERIDDDESAQEKEEMNADESGRRHEGQPGPRREPRYLPGVVPDDEQHRYAAQTVENPEPGAGR